MKNVKNHQDNTINSRHVNCVSSGWIHTSGCVRFVCLSTVLQTMVSYSIQKEDSGQEISHTASEASVRLQTRAEQTSHILVKARTAEPTRDDDTTAKPFTIET